MTDPLGDIRRLVASGHMVSAGEASGFAVRVLLAILDRLPPASSAPSVDAGPAPTPEPVAAPAPPPTRTKRRR